MMFFKIILASVFILIALCFFLLLLTRLRHVTNTFISIFFILKAVHLPPPKVVAKQEKHRRRVLQKQEMHPKPVLHLKLVQQPRVVLRLELKVVQVIQQQMLLHRRLLVLIQAIHRLIEVNKVKLKVLFHH